MGLEVRRLDKDNYLLFVIANDGLYGAFVRVNGNLRSVGKAGGSPAIKANAANALRVTVTGTTFTFIVNGQTLTQVDIGDIWKEGAFGFVAGGGGESPGRYRLQRFPPRTWVRTKDWVSLQELRTKRAHPAQRAPVRPYRSPLHRCAKPNSCRDL